METDITLYQTCIKNLLTEYLSLSTPDTTVKVSFDDERMSYLVIRIGWFQRYTRIHRCLIHLEILDGMIVIQANNTEDELIPELVRMGIPRHHIKNGLVPEDFLVYAEQQERIAQPSQTQVISHTRTTKQLQESAHLLASHA